MSYYCKGHTCPKSDQCLRVDAYSDFVKTTGNYTAAGVWFVDEKACINDNFCDGVFMHNES